MVAAEGRRRGGEVGVEDCVIVVPLSSCDLAGHFLDGRVSGDEWSSVSCLRSGLDAHAGCWKLNTTSQHRNKISITYDSAVRFMDLLIFMTYIHLGFTRSESKHMDGAL